MCSRRFGGLAAFAARSRLNRTGSPVERFTPGLRVSLVRDEQAVRTVEIERVWEREGVLVLKFAGLDTRNDAEELRGFGGLHPFEERPPAPEGEFYLRI